MLKRNFESSIRKEKIVLLHRLTSVSIADRIIVLEDGRIIEEGTRAELLCHDSWFAKLYELQMERHKITIWILRIYPAYYIKFC